jgi:drug/metabolite transporter (DMT)-like permease
MGPTNAYSPSCFRCENTFVLVVFWYLFATMGTLCNKQLMVMFPYPIILSTIQIMASAIFDFAYLRLSLVGARRAALSSAANADPATAPVAPGAGAFLLQRPIFLAAIPVAVALAFGKTLTYISYGKIPVSLTHTVKASSPIFSVILMRLWLKKRASTEVILSLLPICFGIALCGITEIQFDALGFSAALVSSLSSVLQNTLFKQMINVHSRESLITLHLHVACAAILVLLPLAFATDFRSIWLSSSRYVCPGNIFFFFFFSNCQLLSSPAVFCPLCCRSADQMWVDSAAPRHRHRFRPPCFFSDRSFFNLSETSRPLAFYRWSASSATRLRRHSSG